ncbi:MAG TPA: hypothetical protein VGE59_01200 [Patescibacteria group bacterium]
MVGEGLGDGLGLGVAGDTLGLSVAAWTEDKVTTQNNKKEVRYRRKVRQSRCVIMSILVVFSYYKDCLLVSQVSTSQASLIDKTFSLGYHIATLIRSLSFALCARRPVVTD